MNDFPQFANPPVAEVALSVQFESLPAFHAAHFGLLWQEFREKYPKTQEHPPLAPAIERFGVKGAFPPGVGVGIQFSIGPAPPMPRCWFLNDDESQLIQVQQDRFIHNWRRRPDGKDPTYPRYRVLRESFKDELHHLFRFSEQEGIGTPKPNQCELTYVNQIREQPGVWADHGDFARVINTWRDMSGGTLSKPENVSLNVRYLIPGATGEPIGRMYIIFNPIFGSNQSEPEPEYQAQFVARGAPTGPGLDGVFDFLDQAHDYTVAAFLSVTSAELQRAWGIHNG